MFFRTLKRLGVLNMSRILLVSFVVLVLAGCQTVTPQRAREARLMPSDIALKVVEKYTPAGFAANPSLLPALVNHPLCNDRSAKSVRFQDMSVGWSKTEISMFTTSGASFWCGSRLIGVVKVPSEEARDDLLDALISLGAQVATSEK